MCRSHRVELRKHKEAARRAEMKEKYADEVGWLKKKKRSVTEIVQAPQVRG